MPQVVRSRQTKTRRSRSSAPAACAIEALEARWLLAAPLPAPAGTLTGKVVYASAGHGWEWNGSSWVTGRGETNDMVEDFGNQDQLTFYADYLLRAGATVVPMRPVGHQKAEVIVDNNDAGFSIQSGSWTTGTGNPYWSSGNGAEAAHYMFAPTSLSETRVARWTPNIPTTGFYPVYTWALNGSNRSTDALYRINYAGGSQEVKINNISTGKGWVYLGTYYFTAGTSGNVELSNKSGSTGGNVIADAIRFGNGMGDFNAGGGISGKPREDEASLYWLYRSRGHTSANTLVAASVIDAGFSSDDSANVGAPARWGAYMNSAAFGDSVYLSFHSNAGGGRGTMGLYNNESLFPNTATPNQFAWASLVGNEVNDDMVAIGSPPLEFAWFNRSNPTFARSDYAFGEIRSSANGDEFDATIVEVAFHDDASDAALLLDPDVRDAIARASYQATVKYFHTYSPSPPAATLVPDPPTAVRAATDTAGHVTLSWSAPGTGAAHGGAGAATGYKIYTSTNGYDWSDVITVGNVTSTVISGLPTNAPTYFKVVATNAGGESPQRDVVAAKPQVSTALPVLIVNGFDRFDRFTNDTIAFGASGNTVERVRYRYQNTRDYAIEFADALNANEPSLRVETAQNEQVISGAVNLANYQAVLWISGEESTADATFNATERSKITSYLSGGGKLLASGAEIGWDLVGAGSSAPNYNPQFYNTELHAAYVADDAGTHSAVAAPGSAFAGVSGTITFDNGAAEGAAGTYDVEFPDVLGTSNGSTAALNYSGGTGGIAAVQFASGNTRVITMAFPFETITTAAKRNAIMAGVLSFFGVQSGSPAPGTPELLAASDTGSSSSDDITRLNNSSGDTLQFSVPGTLAGATVRIYADGVLIGSATAAGATTTVTTNGLTPLADGTRQVSARMIVSGSPESGDSAALPLIVDTTAPTATLGTQIPTAGATTFDFSVTYGDATGGVDPATFGADDVTVSGPNGFSQSAAFVSAAFNIVNYRITAPGGSWTPDDNGTYTVAQNGDQVGDLAGNTRAAGSIGDIAVDVPFAYLSGTTLHVQYTAPGNPIALVRGLNTLTATQNAATLNFSLSSFNDIVIDGTSAADTLDLSGPIDQPLTFNGGVGGDVLNVHAGTLTFGADAAATTTGLSITVDAGASAVFGATQHLGALIVNGDATLTAGGAKVLVVQSLSVAGTLDLADNDAIVNYDPPADNSPIGAWDGSAYTGLTGRIASARNGGAWDGTGITSSVAGAAGGFRSLGISESAETFNLTAAQTASFSGETVDATAVLIKFSYTGDADLDGRLTTNDYFVIDAGFLNASRFWIHGDFDFNCHVNGDDYFWIDSNYADQTSVL
jgi:hypothetical protein